MKPISRNPVRAVWRRLRNRFERRVIILTYHSIGRPQLDPWRLFVTLDHLREHMEVLRRYGPLLRLPDLADALTKGTLPRRSIAVTFDDGYSDWFQLAKPLLEHLEIPATVFLITGTK